MSTTANRRKADNPYSTFSKGAQAAAKRLAKYARPNSVCVTHQGNGHEQIDAVVHDDEIEVRLGGGVIASCHTQPVGARPEPQSDYFPGHYWKSLAQAIAHCLPDERATARDLVVGSCTGYLSVTIYREGAGLKPVAYLDLHLTNHPTRYGSCKVKRVKAGQLLHLCQAFVAAGGEDIGCTSSILDWLEENHEVARQYIAEARNPPPRHPAKNVPPFTF
jgi:hypothetical protein